MSSINRIRLLDFLRAIAVIAMIFYHFVYDLGDFGYINLITVVNGYWKLFAQSIGCSFLFVWKSNLIHPVALMSAFGKYPPLTR